MDQDLEETARKEGLTVDTLREARSKQQLLLERSSRKRASDGPLPEAKRVACSDKLELEHKQSARVKAIAESPPRQKQQTQQTQQRPRPHISDSEAVIGSIINSQACQFCSDHAVTQDVFIRAALFGWDSIEHITTQCAWWDGWSKIDKLYESLGARRLTKFVILYVISCLVAVSIPRPVTSFV